MLSDKSYEVKLSLEEWQFWQRLRQLVKTYEVGMLVLEWKAQDLTWRVVGRPEPNKV